MAAPEPAQPTDDEEPAHTDEPAAPPDAAWRTPGTEGAAAGDGDGDGDISVEALIEDLNRVSAERDGYVTDLQRVSAEFANFRKQTDKRRQETVDQAAAGLIGKLLPVLDACDAAFTQGIEEIKPVYDALFHTLEQEGLRTVAGEGTAFDPEVHEAVLREPGDDDEPVVAEVMRTGYEWRGRVLRPAMVKVRG